MGKRRRPLNWIELSWSGLALRALTRQSRLFDVRNVAARKPIGWLAQWILDRKLYRCKFDSLKEPGYRFKRKNVLYARDEIVRSRLCTKSNNGLIFLNPSFREMYPDARFVEMSRHPLSLYESWHRRNIMKTPEVFADFYNKIARRMADDRDAFEAVRLIHFEDLVAAPLRVLKELYTFLGLDLLDVPEIRLKAKKHYKKDGTYGTMLKEGAYYWFTRENLCSFFERDISRIQASALPENERNQVLKLTREVCQRLGYSDTSEV